MKTKRTVALVATLAIALTLAIAWSASHTQAFTQVERSRIDFTTIGITPGQNARLNVTHLDGTGQFPLGPCRVELGFVDSDGNDVIPAVQRTLEAGHTTFINLDGDNVAPRDGRINIRPVVRVLDCQGDRGNHQINFAASIELVDHASARTLVVYPGFPTPWTAD
jgi:hypothetical protein